MKTTCPACSHALTDTERAQPRGHCPECGAALRASVEPATPRQRVIPRPQANKPLTDVSDDEPTIALTERIAVAYYSDSRIVPEERTLTGSERTVTDVHQNRTPKQQPMPSKAPAPRAALSLRNSMAPSLRSLAPAAMSRRVVQPVRSDPTELLTDPVAPTSFGGRADDALFALGNDATQTPFPSSIPVVARRTPLQALLHSKRRFWVAGSAIGLIGVVFAFAAVKRGKSVAVDQVDRAELSAVNAVAQAPVVTGPTENQATPERAAVPAVAPTITAPPGGAGSSNVNEPPATGASATGTSAAAKKSIPSSAPRSTPSPKPVKGPGAFDKSVAQAAMNQAAVNSQSCKQPGGPRGQGKVQVTFSPEGRVTRALVIEGPFGSTTVGSCVARMFRQARIPPFTGERVTVQKTFQIP